MQKSLPVRIVYVIEGDGAVREGLARVLSSAGFEARACESVAEFFRQARGLRASCALLDVETMRECQLELLESLYHAACVIPFIALSSSDSPSSKQLALQLGAQSYFHKPVDSSALLDSIEWVMQRDGRIARS